MTPAYPAPATRRFITASVMAATVMNSLDSTIANVALPHMQGSVSASQDQITWVLTSYIVAAAIMTPLTGWLAGRFGRKRLMLWSIVGFTIASGLCGIATSLGELVGFRLLQGVFGAALVPMSQAILLDINPPERHGPAMSIWGMGAILGPIIGPALGGWLTDNLTWRWVFYINLPIGILAFIGLSAFLSETKNAERIRLDLFGFAMLALGIASLQLMLDRGQQLDWFSSLEICIEGAATLFFFYLFLVHTLTARRPFIDLALFKDRNFVTGSVLGFFLGVLIFSVLALLPPMLEELMGYPVVLTGLVTAPRGFGTMISMIVVGQLIRRIDARLLILAGLMLAAWSTYLMAGFSLGMDDRLVLTTGFVQGLGTGLIFVPLTHDRVRDARCPPAQRGRGDVHADPQHRLRNGHLGAAGDDGPQFGHCPFAPGRDGPARQSGDRPLDAVDRLLVAVEPRQAQPRDHPPGEYGILYRRVLGVVRGDRDRLAADPVHARASQGCRRADDPYGLNR